MRTVGLALLSIVLQSCAADLRGPEPVKPAVLQAPVLAFCGHGGSGNCVGGTIGNPFTYNWTVGASVSGGTATSCETRNSDFGATTCSLSGINGVVPNQASGNVEIRLLNAAGASAWVSCFMYFDNFSPCP